MESTIKKNYINSVDKARLAQALKIQVLEQEEEFVGVHHLPTQIAVPNSITYNGRSQITIPVSQRVNHFQILSMVLKFLKLIFNKSRTLRR